MVKNVKNTLHIGIKQLLKLDDKLAKLRKPTSIEEESLHAQHRFEATYYSNKLEGNKLTKEEARKAILFK
ncbi:MAG: hypothetical protein HYX21_02945 [Candidatus Yanofskybacteria bacterium]|nr:hypothetical protein [Candidatus Yanofskybacteria bacterium]